MTQEIILHDNQIEYADILSFDILKIKEIKISYIIRRGILCESGSIELSYDPLTLLKKIIVFSNLDYSGVDFCAIVENNEMKLRYVSTNTGYTPIFKYNIEVFEL
jgi:hypothetical protein